MSEEIDTSIKVVRDYYVVEGKDHLEELARCEKVREEVKNRAFELRDEFGAEAVSVWETPEGGWSVAGFTFKIQAPAGWKRVKKGSATCMPKENTKEGKALAERIRAVRHPGPREVMKRLGINTLFSGMHVHYTTFTPKVNVICRPRDASKEPVQVEGFRRIEEWEYHKLIHEWNERVKQKRENRDSETL